MTILLSVLSGLWLVSADGAAAGDRLAAEILNELNAAKSPTLDSSRREDAAYNREFRSRNQETMEKRAALILELYEAEPDHEMIPSLMFERWQTLTVLGKRSDVEKEIRRFLATTSNQRLKREAMFDQVRQEIFETARTGVIPIRHINEYIKLERDLELKEGARGGYLLEIASQEAKDDRLRLDLENRILKEYPTSPNAERIRGLRRRRAAIGKPFYLEFIDAIKGRHVSIKQLRGKVVVIDFWATWCAPCVTEISALKELYAKYREFGVEFIGVSLDYPADRGGLDDLKKCVAEKGISWPQYYQGQTYDGPLSKACGVFAVPTVFVIDPAGNVYSTEANGKLETIIPELIEAREEGRFDNPVSQPKSRATRNRKLKGG
jgi:thiol-disulfide isomerase/thioredoxin